MNRRGFLRASVGVSLGASIGAAAARSFGAEPAADKFNESIELARQAALDVLKPTPGQLQHGLELHAASLVFESYGFSPRAAIDGEALCKAIEAGASDREVQDLREEMTMTRAVTDAVERAEYLEAWRASGVTCVFQNAGEECQSPQQLLKRLARFTYVADMLRDSVGRAATPDDIVRAKEEKRHCLYLTGNGVPLAQEWTSVEEELGFVRLFFQLGIRMMHLTYNRRNMIGDGCAEPSNGGLSDFGRAVVAEMNRVGVIPDVAHSGWQTSLEAAKVSKRPVVASHSVCAGLNHHIRGKPDEVIKALADSGGLIGICCIPSFLGGSGDLLAMLDHIDYAVKRFGADHVAIGTDVAYSSRQMGAEQKKVPKTGPARKRWESFWPADAFKLSGNPLSMAWTNWPMFTVGMVQRGHSDEVIQKILGGNVLRVARAALAR